MKLLRKKKGPGFLKFSMETWKSHGKVMEFIFVKGAGTLYPIPVDLRPVWTEGILLDRE